MLVWLKYCWQQQWPVQEMTCVYIKVPLQTTHIMHEKQSPQYVHKFSGVGAYTPAAVTASKKDKAPELRKTKVLI